MKYLLDTCAFIELLFEPQRLSPRARQIIEGDASLVVSIASFWEIMIKEQIGKLGIKHTTAQELKAACDALKIEVIHISIDQIDRIRTLPRYKDHGDPFDRLIICQAMDQRLPIITSDTKMTRYDVEVIW